MFCKDLVKKKDPLAQHQRVLLHSLPDGYMFSSISEMLDAMRL